MAGSSQRCSHRKTACGRCNSGICSACCKCPKLLGRPRKNSEMGPNSLNDHRASWPTNVGDAVPEEGLSAKPAHQIASRSNILNIYKLMGLEEAYGDINNVQSLKARMKVSSMWSEPYCLLSQ